ncbi:MAG: hypothetical protein L6R45_33795 [Anaerolineae bacterium]|nr:hypothetical protein [Anaerolineae bacterium]
MQKIVCPICKRDDRVQKVTSIITAQSREISGGSHHTRKYVDKKGKLQSEDYYVPYKSESSSLLAQSLNHPPPKPGAGCNDTLGLILGGGMLIVGLPCLFCALLSGVFGGAQFFSSTPQEVSPGNLDPVFVSSLVNGGLTVIQGLFGIGLIIAGIVVYRKLNQSHRERLARYNNIELPKWEKAMERWEKLYYCYRNDCVFLAGEQESVPISEMNQLLYQD